MTTMRPWMAVSAAALTLALANGCKENKEPDPTTTTTTRTPTTVERATTPTETPTPSTPPVALADEDREFMTKAAQGGAVEVTLGQKVAREAASPDVKAFGSKMVADHSKANDELKALAAKKGAVLPTQLDKEHQDVIEKMSTLTGAKLDEAYAKDMVSDHEEDVKEFRKASSDVKDPELRAWAAKTLPVLEGHLAMAKDMKAKTKH